MSYAIMDIKGIGPLMADKLKKVGIRTTAKLLETAKSAKGRKELASKIGVDDKTILRWASSRSSGCGAAGTAALR